MGRDATLTCPMNSSCFRAVYQSANGLLPISGIDLLFGKSIFRTTEYHTSNSDQKSLLPTFALTAGDTKVASPLTALGN